MKRMRNVAPSIFQQIEKNYGNINELVDANMSILTLKKTNQLTKKSLEKLFTHQVAAIRILIFSQKKHVKYYQKHF